MTTIVLALMLLQGYQPPFDNYETTAYCPCVYCNGNTHEIAKNGEKLVPNWSIAVDDDLIPLGSIVYIKGVGIRKAVDTGSAIQGKRIDILFHTHENALNYGRNDKEVFICSFTN